MKKIKKTKKRNRITLRDYFKKFYPIDRNKARKKLNYDTKQNIILFSSSFNIPIKNYELAREAIKISKNNFLTVELVNKSRKEVLNLLNACDMVLMTSKNEGSPQIIKEAMACNRPIISTDVGDVREVISKIEGCYISNFSPKKLAQYIDSALKFTRKEIALMQEIKYCNLIIKKYRRSF